ncbi:hypothetical protein [Sciscionella sediminilitoris]|uniref:hypothetical protein n=1 Tax=Sciscionella sediminilitoris TaxID=1445613 RepID=UPI0004DF73C3|nr:hypothetical protein [Sciscionella sp. SE31]
MNTRPADIALAPEELGAARGTRHSFARSFLRAAAEGGWTVETAHWELDGAGRGEAVYRIRAAGRVFGFAVFATRVAEHERTDRVIAGNWDVTACLVEGEVDRSRLAALREQVPHQERGRADTRTLVWTRANRSRRFFDYVVDRLASGGQPETAVLGDTAYILRSTAFYSNGKFGMAGFTELGAEHPLGAPYRAQMLAAWLLREFSCELAEHCAAARVPGAARLDERWRRYLGLGNATGLGMVPYVVNHPRVLDAWCTARERPLAHARGRRTRPDGADTERVRELLDRAREYFRERADLDTAPYLPYPELAAQLDELAGLLAEYIRAGTMSGRATEHAWDALYRAARGHGPEACGALEPVLVEPYPELDAEIEKSLWCAETLRVPVEWDCARLRSVLDSDYRWADRIEHGDRTYFWFSSANNEEPRRGRRGTDPGDSVEYPLDIAAQVAALRADLDTAPDGQPLAEFLLAYPRHRGIIARAGSLHGLPYTEVRANFLAADFLPLHIQRFQLARYGMEHYDPQSTDWLRVVLFSGAPRADELTSAADDWLYPRKP